MLEILLLSTVALVKVCQTTASNNYKDIGISVVPSCGNLRDADDGLIGCGEKLKQTEASGWDMTMLVKCFRETSSQVFA